VQRTALALALLICACRSHPAVAPLAPQSPAGSELEQKKWKFAAYFNEVKRRVRAKWQPGNVWRRIDPDGSKFGRVNRYTLVRVRLRPEGTLAEATVETPSGVPALDAMALEAFRDAAPFPSAPPQLVDKGSGVVDFRFGFFFELEPKPAKPPTPRVPVISRGPDDAGAPPGDAQADEHGDASAVPR
jgi:TonB family protein